MYLTEFTGEMGPEKLLGVDRSEMEKKDIPVRVISTHKRREKDKCQEISVKVIGIWKSQVKQVEANAIAVSCEREKSKI
jgi:hypothetical protein